MLKPLANLLVNIELLYRSGLAIIPAAMSGNRINIGIDNILVSIVFIPRKFALKMYKC